MRFLPFRAGYLTRLVVIILAVIVMANPMMGGLAKININDPLSSFQDEDIVLTDARLQHILYGDRSGGGHLHGVGKPCKSEFPASWDAPKIESVVKNIAANDNIAWKQQDNGYEVTTVRVENVSVRVVIDPAKHQVVTAYPVNGQRNACPAAANDN